MSILRDLSIVNRGIRCKMLLAYALMSIIPMLAFTFVISSYLFPDFKYLKDLSLIVLISVVMSALGFYLAKRIIDTVANLSVAARRIAGGDFDGVIAVEGQDELGTLGDSINTMKLRIKTNLEELKEYGQSMKDINSEIQKKVLALSALLQIGDMISSGTGSLEYILEMAVEKTCAMFERGFAVLYMPREAGGDMTIKVSHNLDEEALADAVIKADGTGFLDKAARGRVTIKLDESVRASKEVEEFRKKYETDNALILPIRSGAMSLGLFLVGNRVENYRFTKDDIETASVFAKHIVIAVESDVLHRTNRELSIRDDLTGLFNKRYILTRLEEEIKRSIYYQRPCSFVELGIDGLDGFRQTHGEIEAEELTKRVSRIVKDFAGPIGQAARMSGSEFAIILPEKNKREAFHIAEEIRKKVEAGGVLKDGKSRITVSVGLSENPLDGATSDDLFKTAAERLDQARRDGMNRVKAQ